MPEFVLEPELEELELDDEPELDEPEEPDEELPPEDDWGSDTLIVAETGPQENEPWSHVSPAVVVAVTV